MIEQHGIEMSVCDFIAARFNNNGLCCEDPDGTDFSEVCDEAGKRIFSDHDMVIWQFADGTRLGMLPGGCWDILIEECNKDGNPIALRSETNPEHGEPPIVEWIDYEWRRASNES